MRLMVGLSDGNKQQRSGLTNLSFSRPSGSDQHKAVPNNSCFEQLYALGDESVHVLNIE